MGQEEDSCRIPVLLGGKYDFHVPVVVLQALAEEGAGGVPHRQAGAPWVSSSAWVCCEGLEILLFLALLFWSVQPAGTLDIWPLWFKRGLPLNPLKVKHG